MNENRPNHFRYRVDATDAGKTFDAPAPDIKSEQQPKRGRSKEKKPLSPEEEALRKEVQHYIDARGRSIQTFAGDLSLTFKLDSAFYIDLDKGVVSMDIRWFKDKNCTKEQIFWAILHELSHFKDLKADPKGTEEGFEHLKEQARSTARVMLKKIEDAFGASDPEYVANIKRQRPLDKKNPREGSFNAVEQQAFRFHHRMDNILKDIYVNHDVRRSAPTYADGAEGAEHITNLYKDKLFPGVDYQKKPLHSQMMDALLRQEMVPGETVTVSPEVEEVLQRKMTVFGKKYTARELIDRFLKPARDRSTTTSTRDFLIRETIEPLYLELLMKDLENWNPEKPPQPQQSQDSDDSEEDDSEADGSSDPLGVNPFKDMYDESDKNSPDQFDEKNVGEWSKAEKKRDADISAQQEKNEVEAKKSAAQKAKETQKSKDAAWCVEHAVNPETLDSYRSIEAKVKPYIEDLAQLWRRIAGLGGRETRRVSQGYFKTGSPDIPYIVQNFPGIVSDNEHLVATTLEQSRVMRREVREELPAKFPELIRVRMVGDLSGSMHTNRERLEALRQATILVMSSLREFNYYLDQTRGSSGTKLRTDTEVWGFGSSDKARILKKFRQDDPLQDDLAAIVSLAETMNQELGGTADFSALEGIETALLEQDKKAIREGKILEIVLEITDGGSDDPQKTRESVDRLTAQGSVVRALQIGIPSEQEIEKFQSAWNNNTTEARGQFIGSDLGKLAPAVAELLKRYLGNVKI